MRAIISASEDRESRQGLLLTVGGAGGYYRGGAGSSVVALYVQDGSGVDGWTQIEDLVEGLGAGCWRRSVVSLKEAQWSS